jgi:hypothetical protein
MPAALPPRPHAQPAAVSAKTLLLLSLLLLGGGFIAWRATRPPPPPPPAALPLVQEQGAYRLELTPMPYPLFSGHGATLNLKLTFQGQPVKGAGVHGSAHKPVFSPPVELDFREFRDGEYTAELTPDQTGQWNLHISFMIDGTRRTASFWLQARD